MACMYSASCVFGFVFCFLIGTYRVYCDGGDGLFFKEDVCRVN